MCCPGVQSEPFFRPVDCALLPQYTDYVHHPMDFSMLEKVRCSFNITIMYTVSQKLGHHTLVHIFTQF